MSWFPGSTAAAVANGNSNFLVEERKVSQPVLGQVAPPSTPQESKLSVIRVPQKGMHSLQSRKGRSRSRAVGVVPQLETSIVCSHKFRFECTTGESVNVSLLNLFGILGNICTVANTTLVGWAGSLRLRKVEIYESAQSVSTVNSVINWYTNSNANLADKLTLNSTIPYDLPSKNVSIPPKNTLASFWWNTSSSSSLALFGLQTAVGSIVDVTIDFTLGNQAGGYMQIVSTANLAGDYYLALDGPASNKLVPLGLPTTH